MNDYDESVYFLVNLVVLVSLGILVNLSSSDDSGESAFFLIILVNCVILVNLVKRDLLKCLQYPPLNNLAVQRMQQSKR